MKARGLPVPEMYEPPTVETKPPATAAAASSQSMILLHRFAVTLNTKCYGISTSKRGYNFTGGGNPELCYFLPHCMECSRGIAMGILSVRLSVHPSVRQTRAL